jgi:DNA-binding GntR family transcriptional regulator
MPARNPLRIGKGESSQFAYQALRRDIVSLALAPGSLVEEPALVAQLGLSRTPVREALVRLAGENLVELLPNRGARVAPMSWTDIRENLEALEVSQRLATRWAALRRTDAQLELLRTEAREFERLYGDRKQEAMTECNWRFHAGIAAACHNEPVADFYRRVLTANLRISRLAMTGECFGSECEWRAHVDSIVAEHRGMVDAIERQDADRAEALALSHTDLARKRVRETLAGPLPEGMQLALGMDPVAS